LVCKISDVETALYKKVEESIQKRDFFKLLEVHREEIQAKISGSTGLSIFNSDFVLMPSTRKKIKMAMAFKNLDKQDLEIERDLAKLKKTRR
jgi:hypothetical protein